MRRAARALAVALVFAPSLPGARTLAAAESPARAANVHEVRRGDTLWTIAEQDLGDGALWLAVYRANRDQIKDPKVLHPGQRLAIPSVAPEERDALRREGFRGLGSPAATPSGAPAMPPAAPSGAPPAARDLP